MLEEMIQAVMEKMIATRHPHLKLPAVVFAKVDSARKLAETFQAEELVIHNDETGGSYKGHIVSNWYEYKLMVIDRFGSADGSFPPLPGIRSRKQFKAGAVVAVALPYGDITPAIIGEVEI